MSKRPVTVRNDALDDALGVSDHDLVGLAFYDSGSRSFYNSQHPITSVEDMKGMKKMRGAIN